MMSHIKFFLAIAVGLYFVNTYETEADRLMNSSSAPIVEGAGIREVDVDTERYDYSLEIVKGTYTILYFYSDSCHGCRLLHSQLPKFLEVRPDVAVRMFDLGYEWSGDDAYNTYGLRIGMTPFIHIYDPEGDLVAEDAGTGREGFNYLYKWMNAELRKAWDREHAS